MKSKQPLVDWPKKALFDQIPLEIIVINKDDITLINLIH